MRGYCCREHYTIHPKKSEDVTMNRENDIQSSQPIEYGCEPIQKVKSTVHLGVKRNKTDRPDLNLNLNSLLVKRQIDNPSPGAVTGGN